ncbi:MAG TPA: hypothetical protein PLM79_13280 [Syntrophobacteraceae bacterium]|nr:hypothetical protein [Syntrophobacteraceae bacterium]
MAVDLYTLRRKAILILGPKDLRQTVHVLQLAVRNALSQDAQALVDQAVRAAYREWDQASTFPQRVVQVGMDGNPKPGSPIFPWSPARKVFCFDSDLLVPWGYVGERGIHGYSVRSQEEQAALNDSRAGSRVDGTRARVYRGSRAGKAFGAEHDFSGYGREAPPGMKPADPSFGAREEIGQARMGKIVSLIRLIESKGPRASLADREFLHALKQKASQLAHFPLG